MAQREMRALVIQVVKVVVVSGCVIALLTGCSSRLRTTIVSGSEAPKVHVTQLEPEIVTVENVVSPLDQKEMRMDTPMEKPAKPALRRELQEEIFATSKSIDAPSEISSFSEAPPPVSADEPITSSMIAVPFQQQSSKGIPSISFEPEMPALPIRPLDEISSVPQDAPLTSVVEPDVQLPIQQQSLHTAEAERPQDSPMDAPHMIAQADVSPTPEQSAVQKAPVQVAKVMPQESEPDRIMTETLEAALSDIYFDYDQFAIRDGAGELLKANAQLFASTFAETHVVIEGHCDERGTQSYNMVLGERRAKAVKLFLQDLGVPAENLQVVSYGKERPFCTEQTEACWQENRRGHFVIK